MATDIAFALGVIPLLGSRVPLGLKVFLAALAIVDDMGAVVVMALFYTSGIDWLSLGIALLTLVTLVILNVRSRRSARRDDLEIGARRRLVRRDRFHHIALHRRARVPGTGTERCGKGGNSSRIDSRGRHRVAAVVATDSVISFRDVLLKRPRPASWWQGDRVTAAVAPVECLTPGEVQRRPTMALPSGRGTR